MNANLAAAVLNWASDDLAHKDVMHNIRQRFGAKPTPLQAMILQAVREHPRVAVKTAHGFGKTFTAALAGLDFMSTQPDPMVICTAPIGRQYTRQLWPEIKRWGIPVANRFGWELLPDTPLLKTQNPKSFLIAIPSDDPATFEGYHARSLMVIADEAKALKDDIFASIDSLQPDRILLTSTPGMPVGKFYQACQSEAWHTIEVDAELHNDSTGERIPLQWVTQMQQDYGVDSPIYQQKVRARFAMITERPYFKAESIDAAIRLELPPGAERGLAIDWGKHVDYTALVEFNGNKVTSIKTTQQDYMITLGQVAQAHRERPFSWIIADRGAGEGQIERLKELGLPVEGFAFTTKSKLDIMSNLKLALEAQPQPEIDLPSHGWMEEQLKGFEQTPRSDGAVKLAAPSGMHDDIVDALAMGCWKMRKAASHSQDRLLIVHTGRGYY